MAKDGLNETVTFLRLFLWHICAKGHALGALIEMEARVCKYNPWEYGWRDGWTECLNQRVAGILKQACVDFSDAD